MTDFIKKVRKVSGETLGPDEPLVAAMPFQTGAGVGTGTAAGAAAGGLVGAAIGAAADRKARKKVEDERPDPGDGGAEAAFEIPAGGTIAGLTARRLLLWEQSAMGKPKGLCYEVALDQIAGVEQEHLKAKVFPARPKGIELTLALKDGRRLRGFAPMAKPSEKAVNAFMAELAQRTGA